VFDCPFCKPLDIQILAEGNPQDTESDTHDTAWLVNRNKLTLSIFVWYFHRSRRDRRFVAMYIFSMRSPLRTIVSGLAILPLIVVTPDSSAYLYKEHTFSSSAHASTKRGSGAGAGAGAGAGTASDAMAERMIRRKTSKLIGWWWSQVIQDVSWSPQQLRNTQGKRRDMAEKIRTSIQ
jgi:hypothetical protein